MLAWLAFGGEAARASANYQPYAFTHFAGPLGGPGYSDGTGSAARFNGPSELAVDSSGNVYVADSGNHTIRKITSGGVVTTLAGLAGYAGSADGSGSAARFNGPSGVAVDSSGNVYVADAGNNTIRQITPGGVVSTLAGLAGIPGSADGTGSAARFNAPSGIAVDSSGNVYVADRWNHTIRKISPGGVVTTLAGLAGSFGSTDGTGSAALFYGPSGLAVDSSGNVYVADTHNHTIRQITPGGVVTTLAGDPTQLNQYGNPLGGYADSTGSAALFHFPSGVAVDSSGNVYVGDLGNHAIRQITSGGVVTTLAGDPTQLDQNGYPLGGYADGTGSAARFRYPNGVAVDSSGNVYVADSGNNAIRQITPGGVVTTPAGLVGYEGSDDGTSSAARFNLPAGVAVDASGNVYVADELNHTIRKITPGGVVSTLAGLAGTPGSDDGIGSAARFNGPIGVAVDSEGNVYVAESGNNVIRQIAPGGVVTTLAGQAGVYGSADGTGSAAQFDNPIAVAVDSAGNVYVADSDNNTIRKISPGGVVSTLAGLAGSWGSADGTGSAARFNFPAGVAVDSAGNVYVADLDNDTIRKITPAGVVKTLAGRARNIGSADGTGTAARFNWPTGIAVDSSGNVFVADTRNNTIRKITPAGVVTTLAGLAGAPGSDDGTGSAARFNLNAVAVDSSGIVYVADSGNNAIRKGWVTPALTIAPDGGSGFFIRVQGTANLVYQLQRAPTLNGQWTTNAVQTAPGSGLVEFHDTSPLPDRAFYRAFQE